MKPVLPALAIFVACATSCNVKKEKPVKEIFMSCMSTDIEHITVENDRGGLDTFTVDLRKKQWTSDEPLLTGQDATYSFIETKQGMIAKITTKDVVYTTGDLGWKRNPATEDLPAKIRSFKKYGKFSGMTTDCNSPSEQMRMYPVIKRDSTSFKGAGF